MFNIIFCYKNYDYQLKYDRFLFCYKVYQSFLVKPYTCNCTDNIDFPLILQSYSTQDILNVLLIPAHIFVKRPQNMTSNISCVEYVCKKKELLVYNFTEKRQVVYVH